MKSIFFILIVFLLHGCIKPEQEGVEFGLTIKPMAGPSANSVTKEDEPLLINYKLNKDDDAIDLKVQVNQKPQHGTLNDCKHIGSGEIQCIYVPDRDFFGVDKIGFRANDGDFFSDEVSFMEIKITPVPDNPVSGEAQNLQLAENSIHEFEAIKSKDVDSTELTYEIVDSPKNGIIENCLNQNNDMSCEYTPTSDFYGEDSFTYRAFDEAGLASLELTRVNIKVLNYPEAGSDNEVSVDQYSNVKFNVASAIDGDSPANKLIYKVVTKPIKGVLKKCFVSGGSVSCEYAPNYGALGVDSFSYQVVDETGLISKEVGIVNISIKKVNLAPVPALTQTISLLQNSSKVFSVNVAKDPDSDDKVLKYEIATQPKYGTLSDCLYSEGNLNNRSCRYTPNPQYNGTDSFSYKVTDETGVSSKVNGVIKLIVQQVYQKPVIGANQAFQLNQGSTKVFSVNPGTDVDTDKTKLQYAIVDMPKNGNLTNCFAFLGSINCSYTSNKTYSGMDSFTYKIVDNKGLQSKSAKVDFTVIPKRSPILGFISVISLNQFETKIFAVEPGSDPDTDNLLLNYKVVSAPKNGTLSECFIQAGDLNCTYKPAGAYYGSDSFTYKIVDDYGLESAVSKVDISVNARAKPVPSITDLYTTPEYIAIEFNVTAAVDGDSPSGSLVYSILTLPKNGLLKNCFISTGHRGCEYQPNNKFSGTDSFTYKVTDEYGLVSASEGLVSFKVERRSPPVVGKNLSVKIKQNSTTNIWIDEGTDDDTPVNELQYVIDIAPTHGKLVNCFAVKGDTKCTYIPENNYYGSDFYTYKIIDAYGLVSVSSAKLSINIEKVAVKPIAGDRQVFNMDKNTSKVFDVSLAIDPDTSANLIKYKIATNTTNGVLTNCFQTVGSRNCTYTPTADYVGVDSFTYKVEDETGLTSSNTTIVYFNIVNVNSSPRVGDDQTFKIQQGTNLTFNVNIGADLDSSPNQLKYVVVTTPTNGSLSACFLVLGSLQCTYMPNSAYYGLDSFTYKIEDETGYSSEVSAKVTFNITKRNAPVPTSQTISFDQYSLVNFSVITATDIDSSAGSLTYTVVTPPTNGTLSNCFLTKGYTGCRYTPSAKYYGKDSFTYKVTDEYGIESLTLGTVSIIVNKVDLIPVIGANQSFSFDQDTSKTFNVSKALDDDSAASEIAYKVVIPPQHGALGPCFGANGIIACTYTPTLYWSGTDSFTYKAIDSTGKETVKTATVSFIVNQVNKPPAVGANQAIAAITNKAKNFTVSQGSDVDGPVSELTYTITKPPTQGSLSGCFAGVGVRTCTYTPNVGYYGSDSIEYKVVDKTTLSSSTSAIISITVEKALEKPVVGGPITVALLEGTSKEFLIPMATDVDTFSGDISYNITTVATYGKTTNCFVSSGNRSCTYTPNTRFNGRDSLNYKAKDNTGLASTSSGVVNFIIAGKIYQGEETFTQQKAEIMKSVDFTWVIDNSGSMGNDQAQLSTSFNSFINNFIVNGKAPYPFNMLVTTTDNKIQSSYIGKLTSAAAESDFPKFEADFKNGVTVGTNGSGAEKAFKAAVHAKTNQAAWYGGNDTLSVFIFVSDEWEQSQGNVQQWASSLQSTKDNPAKVRIYSIVASDRQNRFRDAGVLTGGGKFNISGSFDGIMTSIGSAVTSLLDSYLLKGDRSVDGGTLKVYIDDTLIPASEYTYSLNALKFKTPPMANAVIKVTYDYTNIYMGP